MDDINLNEIFIKYSQSDIKEYIISEIHQVRRINDIKSKKKLQKIFPLLLDHIVDLAIKDVNKFLYELNTVIYDLAFLFPELLNDFIRDGIKTLQGHIEDSEIIANNERIISFTSLIVYLTNSLNQTNQFLANYLHVMNTMLAKIDTYHDDVLDIEYLVFKCQIIRLIQIVCRNIKGFNPFILNQLTYILHSFKGFKYVEHDIKADDILNGQTDDTIKQSYCFDLFLNTIDDLMTDLKDDISFDILFSLINQIEVKLDFSHPKVSQLVMFYRSQAKIICNKKNIHINFLTIKRKPIQSLEPDLEENKPKNMTRIIEKKLNKTKRQAIRNLKKEAVVVDSQKQITLQKLSEKRKEELKHSNQFIEQSKVEYKKLITSQDKKRFKLKRKAK
jgi:hypothetical protein